MNKMQQLMQLLEQQPNDAFLLHALALEYIKIGNDEEARKLFENLLTIHPNYVGSYYHLAKLLERNHQINLAKEWYEKGIQVALQANDKHACSELRSAYEALLED